MNGSLTLTPYENALVKLDEFPLGALIRVSVGYSTLPLWDLLADKWVADWQVVLWFIGVLVGMRLVPTVLRKIVPFPSGAVAVWADRRALAKRFDSYQWRKLFWFGVGMGAYLGTTQEVGYWEFSLAAAALAGGAVGEWAWWARSPAATTPPR